MNNAKKRIKDIIKVAFWINVISTIILVIHFNKSFSLFVILINIILLGTFFILDKYSYIFDGLIQKHKFAKELDKKMEEE